jgi:hypothetical protein
VWSYLPFSQADAALLFHLLSRLYEHTNVLITTNLDLAEWSRVFGDAKMTTALLDRLRHRFHFLKTGNEPHRFLHSSSTDMKRIKARDQLGDACRYRGQGLAPMTDVGDQLGVGK